MSCLEYGYKVFEGKAKRLKEDTYTLYLAFKHPRVPWHTKVFIGVILVHTLSPIDLIPDFIPVLGQLDDLIIILAGFSLLLKMIPKEVLEECREKAKSELIGGKPKSWVAAFIIVLIWLLLLYLILRFIWQIAL